MDDEPKQTGQNSDTPVTSENPQLDNSNPLDLHNETQTPEPNILRRFLNWYKTNRKKTIPLSILVLIIVLAIVPWSRYHIAGVVFKNNFSLQVIDSVTNSPVSKADVSIGAIHAQTDGAGKVTLRHIKVGTRNVIITKKYYAGDRTKILVPILKQKNVEKVKLVATGRQVKISVKNLINRSPLSNVDIKIADISAKTDKSGDAIVVLPVGTKSAKATLGLNGYNSATQTVEVSNSSIKENDFTLTPAGKVYFLSNLSGKIDVAKTNLDGTDRQTVLAGTGNEDEQNTVLLASRDWKYLALLSRRAGISPSLYLIDTYNDSVATIDDGNVNFTLLGWSGDYFTYVVRQPAIQPWQSGAQSIRSYNAQTKKLLTLDSTNATGSNLNDTAYETYVVQPILLDNLIVYDKTWYHYPGYLQVSGQSDTLNVVKPDGTGKKIIKSVDAAQSYFGGMVFHAPNSVYVQVSDINTDSQTYYEFNGIGLAPKSNLTDDDFYKGYPTYLYSPDNSSTFWAETRDGKSTLFVGNENGDNGKQIATLSDYQPYGWYGANYLLVSKDNDELYIMPKNGPASQAVKITDYHKSAQTLNGYGGGYGGQ